MEAMLVAAGAHGFLPVDHDVLLAPSSPSGRGVRAGGQTKWMSKGGGTSLLRERASRRAWRSMSIATMMPAGTAMISAIAAT